MSLFQNAMKASRLIRTVHPNQSLRPLLSGSARHFSTEAQPPNQQTSADPFLQSPLSGLVYGRLSGIAPRNNIMKYTLKSDVIRLLDESNLSPDDLKFNYDRRYEVTGVMIQFPSRNAYDAAVRAINRQGRLYKLEKVDCSVWDNTRPYDGKFVLLQGLPQDAQVVDIERFLSGCQHDSSSLQLIFRQDAFPNPIRMATVRFPSATLAMDAFITKNRSFCRNNQILMQVLH